jgi:hypothetical protein
MDILREVLERVTFLLDGEDFTRAPKARKVWIHDFYARLLLASVTKELTAEHRDIWVRLLLRLVTVSLRVECVACRMDAEEALSVQNRGE